MDIRVLYREIASIMDRRATPPTRKDLEPFRNELDQIWRGLNVLPDGGWQVDSPWHAALVCVDLMSFAASGVLLDETTQHVKALDQLDGIPACHFIFRGEGNHTYSLCPAYFRPYNHELHDELSRAINNFAALLKFAADRCFGNVEVTPNSSIEMFVGAAQHYLGNTP